MTEHDFGILTLATIAILNAVASAFHGYIWWTLVRLFGHRDPRPTDFGEAIRRKHGASAVSFAAWSMAYLMTTIELYDNADIMFSFWVRTSVRIVIIISMVIAIGAKSVMLREYRTELARYKEGNL